MTINQTKKSVAVPLDQLDKIIYAEDFPVTFHDNTTGKSAAFGTGLGYGTLVKAIYSWDGGATWHDCANYGNWSGLTIEPAIAGRASVDPATGQVNFNFTQHALVNGGVDYTMRIKFALIAPPALDVVDPSFFIFSGKDSYTSAQKYLNVAFQNSFTVSSATRTSTPVAHNLGYVPFYEVFMQSNAFKITLLQSNFGNAGSIGDATLADTSNIYIYTGTRVPTETLTLFYRIYSLG